MLRQSWKTGLLSADAEQVIDSTPIHRAAALEDTCTLLSHGLRTLLMAMGESEPERQRLAKRLKLSHYLSKTASLRWSVRTPGRDEHTRATWWQVQRLCLLGERAIDVAVPLSPGQCVVRC